MGLQHASLPRTGAAPLPTLLAALASAIVVGALVLRGVRPAPPPRLDLDPERPPALAMPMQLLRVGGETRFDELETLIAADRRTAWWHARELVSALADCPKLADWVLTADGQAFERDLVELRAGGESAALGALTLVFALARATEWDPGLMARTQHSEQLGRLFEEWLLARGPSGIESPLLHEPVLHALIAYGAVMRRTYDAPLIGRNESARERARGVLHRLLGPAPDRRTQLGRIFADRFPRAALLLDEKQDILRGFAEEAAVLFPGLDGECERR